MDETKPEVLIIDDEHGMRDMLAYALGRSGYQVTGASSGPEGLELLQRGIFDLALLDIKMPGMDGSETLRRIKEHRPDLPVVMMTGHATVETAVSCMKLGALDYLQKPFEIDQLLTVVQRALEHNRLSLLVAMFKAGLAILGERDGRVLTRRIVELVMECLAAEDASLLLVDPAGELRLAYSHALSHAPESAPLSQSLVGPGVARRVSEVRAPVLLPEGLGEDPRFADLPDSARVCSSIVYPLTREDRLVGVLNINRLRRSHPFRPQDLQKVTVLASSIALALENTRLVEELGHRITELETLQGQLVQSEKMAAYGQLAASIAHEINNPASFVLGNVESLSEAHRAVADFVAQALRAGGPAEVHQLAERGHVTAVLEVMGGMIADVSEGTRRIVETSADLRGFARLGEKTRERFPLQQSLDTALRIARNEIQQRGRLATHLAADLEVVGSPGQLSQVFLNLLINAAQALEGQPYAEARVELRLERRGERAVVTVSDNGHGITAAHLGSIFDPFFTTKAPGQGTGLGLPICHTLVTQHGGELEVRSTPGEGTCFTVTLPLASPGETASGRRKTAEIPTPAILTESPGLGLRGTTNAAGSPAAGAAPLLRLLYIDDEAAITRMIERSLGQRHQITTADSGARALEILAGPEPFDAVVCDLLLPEMSGLEIFWRAGELRPALKGRFFFATGGAITAEAAAFVDAHEERVLHKPFSPRQLEQWLLSHLSRVTGEPA